MAFDEYNDEQLSNRLVGFAGPLQAAMIAELGRRQAVKSHQLLSGEAMYHALSAAVNNVVPKTPTDNDVLIEAFGLLVQTVQYVEPHTFIFLGNNRDGHFTCAAAHFSQVVMKVVFRPKQGPTRIITAFARA